MNHPKTILIVDDQKAAVRGLKALFAEIPEFEVVGEAANGQEAIQWAAANLPNIVVMDVKMPVMDGLIATRHLRKLNLPVRVVLISISNSYEPEALSVGADAFVCKSAPPEQLLAVLHALSTEDNPETKSG